MPKTKNHTGSAIPKLCDIKPQTPIATLDKKKYASQNAEFSIEHVARVVGMSVTFIKKVVGNKKKLGCEDLITLLDQDSYGETYIPRSKVIDFLISEATTEQSDQPISLPSTWGLVQGQALDCIKRIPAKSVQCVVTSTPYWGLRIYKESSFVKWGDGDFCPFGHEQTPEAFSRHTIEILASLYDVLADNGSIWWNVMDSFNTRTQIRSNAAEALKAMQGKDNRSWADHECRRYSAGHAYLKDGEQCLIPSMIAERASRIGFYVKTIVTWAKTATLPEPQESRVSRNLEYILHLTKQRTPLFNKDSYRTLPPDLGGRNKTNELDKLSDVWTLSTSSGRDGHGAQFPISLPARCIALGTNPGDLVLDPFVGAGNSGIAARLLDRRFLGIDVSEEYLDTAQTKINETSPAKLSYEP